MHLWLPRWDAFGLRVMRFPHRILFHPFAALLFVEPCLPWMTNCRWKRLQISDVDQSLISLQFPGQEMAEILLIYMEYYIWGWLLLKTISSLVSVIKFSKVKTIRHVCRQSSFQLILEYYTCSDKNIYAWVKMSVLARSLIGRSGFSKPTAQHNIRMPLPRSLM